MRDIARRIIFYSDDSSMYTIYEHEYVVAVILFHCYDTVLCTAACLEWDGCRNGTVCYRALVYFVFNYSHLFWMGDLNYRIAMSDPEVKEKVKKKEWTQLFHADQVHIPLLLCA